MSLHWPQYVWLILTVAVLLLASIADGTPKTGTNRFVIHLCGTVFQAWLLWCGGFFG